MFEQLLTKTSYIKKEAHIMETQTEVNMEVLRGFNVAGLEFAFPTQTLYTINQESPSTIELDALAVLNGVEASEVLPKGTLVKRVVGKDPPKN